MPTVICNICNRSFSNLRGLHLHTYKVHRVADVASNPGTHVASISSGTPVCPASEFECELCKEVFANNTGLHLHKLRKHRVLVDTASNSAGTSLEPMRTSDGNSAENNASSAGIPHCDGVSNASTLRKSVHSRSSACSAVNDGVELPPIAGTSRRPVRSSAGKRSSSFAAMYDLQTNTRSRSASFDAMYDAHTSTRTDLDLPSCSSDDAGDNASHIVSKFTADVKRLREKYLQTADEQHDPISDQLHAKLKQYVEQFTAKLNSIATLRVSEEVAELVDDATEIGNENRKSQFSIEQQIRLDRMKAECKTLKCPTKWTWAAGDESNRGKFNKERMELCVKKELIWKVMDCPECKSTGL